MTTQWLVLTICFVGLGTSCLGKLTRRHNQISGNVQEIYRNINSQKHEKKEKVQAFLENIPNVRSAQKCQSLLDHNIFIAASSSMSEFGAGKFTCYMCKVVSYLIKSLMKANTSSEEIKRVVQDVCTCLAMEKPRVCQGLVDEFAPEVLTVLRDTPLTPSEVCGFVFGPECGAPYSPQSNWSVTFPEVPQPPSVYPTPPRPGSPTFRFLHLTDIHFDLDYQEGSETNCGEPLCCRGAKVLKNGAWRFGDYRNCDTPLWTLKDMLSTLAAQNETFDYIIWTGDLPPHNVWNQTRTDQLTVLKTLVGLLLEYFPNKPVFPSLGNHESSPVNSFPPPYVQNNNSISWLYEALADGWKQWLPSDALDSVRRGAYYTVSPYPGFRIISLNMNYCNNQNWWMLLNASDPAGELQWLISTLQVSEDKGEKVHIIGHIPPGVNDCLKTWSWNYYRVVSRYQNTIAGQFFGHTHFDSFSVFYDVETLQRPVSVAYVAPSVTPFSNLNMGYRFYTADGKYKNSSFQILDHETYYLNLTRANLEGKITWELEYSAKASYGMSNLFPADWNKLIELMRTNTTVLETYNRFYTKSRSSGSCDASCRVLRLCETRSGRSHDPNLCKDLGIKSDQDFEILQAKQPKHC